MHARIRSGFTFANVVSLLALFIALGGTSYAAITIPKNAIKAKQIATDAVRHAEIQANAVRASELATSAVTSTDIADGAVGTADLADNAVTTTKVTDGTLTNADVAAGTYLRNSVIAVSSTAAVELPDTTKASYGVYCPAGYAAIGGGGRGDATSSEETVVTSSRPSMSAANTEPPAEAGGSFTGWRITVFKPGTSATEIKPTVWAICTLS